MDVEPLGLEAGEAIGDGLEPFPHGLEMIQPFLQAEVAQVVGEQFVAQEAGELLVLFEEARSSSRRGRRDGRARSGR